MQIVVLGLSLTSSWGNGHASTYRSLLAALARRRHQILFLERDAPWYAGHRDLTSADYARIELYTSLDDLQRRFLPDIESADLVIVGSYVPEGPAVIDLVLGRATGVRAFYDIDTPITIARLNAGQTEYVRPEQISEFDLYLSFAGGPVLETLERTFGARRARPLYCSVDPGEHQPDEQPARWHLGYLGTYSPDRAAGLRVRLMEPARLWSDGRFVVAGAEFPPDVAWPGNVDRMDHVPLSDQRRFYSAQRFTLNLTRTAMSQAGYSPSIRLFEAAACGVPVITDPWPGLETFFVPGKEILVSHSTIETLEFLMDLPEKARRRIANRARERALAQHTSDHRAREVEQYVAECS